jgi:hypothetical protein
MSYTAQLERATRLKRLQLQPNTLICSAKGIGFDEGRLYMDRHGLAKNWNAIGYA